MRKKEKKSVIETQNTKCVLYRAHGRCSIRLDIRALLLLEKCRVGLIQLFDKTQIRFIQFM